MSDYKKYVEPSPKKIRRKYFPELHDEAVKILNAYFVNNRYPTKSDREHLVKYINDELKTNSEGMKQLIGVDHLFTISPREVDTWFQNRRNETSSPPPLDDLGESQWLSVSTPFVYRPPPFKSDKHRSHRENQKSKPESEDGVYQEWKKRLFSLPPPPRPISPASAPSEVDKLKKEIRKLKLDSTSTKSKQWKDIATMPVWTPSTSFRPPTSTSYGYEKKLHEMLLEEAARERERVDLQKSTRLPPPLLSPRPEQSWANIPMIWDVTATPTSSYVQPPPATMPHTPTSSYVQPRPKSLASPSFVYNNDEDYSTVAAVDRAVSKPRQPPARMPHRHSYVEPRPKPPPLLLPPTSTSTKPTSTRLPPATHIHSYAPRPSSTKTQYMLGPTPREIKIISDPDENKSEYNLKKYFQQKAISAEKQDMLVQMRFDLIRARKMSTPDKYYDAPTTPLQPPLLVPHPPRPSPDDYYTQEDSYFSAPPTPTTPLPPPLLVPPPPRPPSPDDYYTAEEDPYFSAYGDFSFRPVPRPQKQLPAVSQRIISPPLPPQSDTEGKHELSKEMKRKRSLIRKTIDDFSAWKGIEKSTPRANSRVEDNKRVPQSAPGSTSVGVEPPRCPFNPFRDTNKSYKHCELCNANFPTVNAYMEHLS